MRIWKNLFGEGDRIHSDVIDVNGEKLTDVVNAKANKQAEGWKTPTPLNGWSQSSSRPLRYRINSFGELQFKGRIGYGEITEGTILFRLPAGYRVIGETYILVMTVSGRNLSPVFLFFHTNGDVELYAGTSLAWINFDNLTLSL